MVNAREKKAFYFKINYENISLILKKRIIEFMNRTVVLHKRAADTRSVYEGSARHA